MKNDKFWYWFLSDKDGSSSMRKFLAFTGGLVFNGLAIFVTIVSKAIPDKVLYVYAGIFGFYFCKEIFQLMQITKKAANNK